MDQHNFKLKIPFITTLCLLGSLWLGLPAAMADTTVGGTIATDTTWSLAGSPYVVTANIAVQGTDGTDSITTLTIEPGVQVRINNSRCITIGSSSGDPGALVAQGTAASPIVFTSSNASPAPGNWTYIKFDNTSDDATSIMDHCTVAYAGASYAALYLYKSSPTITHTTIRNNSNAGIYAYNSTSVLTDNTIANNATYGIRVYSNAAPQISNTTFSNNGDYDIHSSSTTGATISANTIEKGIYVGSGITGGISANTIQYHNSFPIRLGADGIGELLSANTITNTDDESILEVTTDTIEHDAIWSSLFQYVLLGNLTVQGIDGADNVTTLTLSQGTRVRIDGRRSITIGASSGDPGALVASGTADNPILFTTNSTTPTPGSWYYIRFRNTCDDSQSTLDHCVVENAGYRYGAIYLDNASPTITNTTVRFSSTAGLYAYGSGSAPTEITCNTFTNNQYGIYWRVSPPPEMHTNNFFSNTDNGIRYTGAATLNAENNWWGDAAGPNQSGDSFSGNVDADPWSVSENQCGSGVINYPPNPPVNPSPADETVHVNTDPNITFGWDCTDPNAEDTLTFDLYLGTDPAALPPIAQDLTASTHTVNNLSGGVTYYWQIIARDNGALETPGPVWSFTSEGDPPDLIVTSITTSPVGGIPPGSRVTFTAVITNISGTGPVVDSFDTEIRVDGSTIGTITNGTIIPQGASIQISRNWTYTGGNPTITVGTDTQAAVAETNEQNNQLESTLAALADITAPLVSGQFPNDGQQLQQVDQITVTLTDTQSAVDDAAVIASFSVTDAAQQYLNGNTTESSDTFTFVPDNPPLTDGRYQVNLTAADTYENSQTYTFAFTIDTVPPAKPIITGGNVSSGVIQARPAQNSSDRVIITLEGTREDNTSVWVNGIQYAPLGTGGWSFPIELAMGANALEIYCLDEAANQSESEWVDITCNATGAVIYEYDASGRLKRIETFQ